MATRILGLDLGIASCGWGVIDVGETVADTGRIIAAGVRCFDPPLVDKTGTPKSAARREARGQRRVIKRRRQRMKEVRSLLHENDILPDAKPEALHQAAKRVSQAVSRQITPWSLRSEAHERRLTDDELAVVLGHIARHRGFRSNAKSEGQANAPDETSKMKKAMEETRESLAKYRSFGDMLQNDIRFSERKRNRDREYSYTPKRSDLEDETRAIFQAQRRLGNPKATEALQSAFMDAGFFQRPLQDSDRLVANCIFENCERRTALRAPSFELFRYLSRLANLELSIGRASRKLTADEIRLAAQHFGNTKTVTFKALRKLLDIDPNARFSALEKDRNGKDIDVVARSGGAAYGTKTLKDVLGIPAWSSLTKRPGTLDRIAEILTFRQDFNSIRVDLSDLGLDDLVVNILMTACEEGTFNDFTRASRLSALACRNIIPGLMDGHDYAEACARVGYDHAARPAVSLDQINSPVTRRAFGEALKQVRAIDRKYGPFDQIHIELARDVGKSAEQRKEISSGIEARNVEKDKRRREAAEILGRAVSDEELLRYELAKEQQFKCLYSGEAIVPDGFAANDTRYQVDHILPWSRFGDDSFLNKTLCTSKANQDKRGRTPFEWFLAEWTDEEWRLYVARIEGLTEMKGRKKANYLRRNAQKIETKFKQRNLTDTQWVTRLLANELMRMYPPRPERHGADGRDERRVFARPGAITSKLRRAWGLEHLKKESGERVADDRHHAVDALVLAATTEGLLQSMTKEVQRRENEGRADDIYHVSPPWPGFRAEVIRTVYGSDDSVGVFVSRAVRARARGKAHDATIKQIRDVDGETVVFERKDVMKLKESDLDLIPVPAPYGRIADPKKLRDEMVESLRSWLARPAAERKNNPPRSPKGDVIRKIRLATKDKVAVTVNGGTVDRGDMARVDVFRKQNKRGKWEFYVIPIYPHQIATLAEPPSRAVVAYKAEDEWVSVDSSFEFLWSLHAMDYLELQKSKGECIQGYFRGLHRGTGAINISLFQSNDEQITGIGVKTLSLFKKMKVDRLGQRSNIARETRTWRGKVCT